MELSDTQKKAILGWAEEGLGLSEIQKKLASEFGVNMTYMDVRFLVLDLGCNIQDKKETVAPIPAGAVPGATQRDGASSLSESGDPNAAGGVTVEIDRVVKAGAVVSGTVVFSDGVKAVWAVDNMGRMVLDPGDNEGYRPSDEDVREFQVELKNQITKRGL